MLKIWNSPNLNNTVDISKLNLTEDYLKIKYRLADFRWFVGFGTALGLYRDKATIPGDTDIDICVLDATPEKIKELIFLFNDYELVRVCYKDEQIQQVCFQANEVLIDICFFYADGMDLVNEGESGVYVDNKDVIGDIQFIDTIYGKLPFPEHIEKYFERRYGSDWQTPKYGLISSSLTQ